MAETVTAGVPDGDGRLLGAPLAGSPSVGGPEVGVLVGGRVVGALVVGVTAVGAVPVALGVGTGRLVTATIFGAAVDGGPKDR